MTLRGSLVAAVAALAASLGLWGSPGAAVAQAIPAQAATGTALITAVTPSELSPAESRVMLSFSQLAPQFSIMANDANTVTVAFADARLVPTLTFPGGRHGLIQSMTFAQNDNLLTLTISGSSPIHLAATTLAGRAVSLSVTPYGAPMAADPWPGLGAAPLAAHDGGAPDDVFEVVPLKYADVSEVVGILTANQQVKPNDNFTPQEPAFGSAGMQGSLGAPTFNAGINLPSAAADPMGQDIDDTISIDRRLNAIILKGAPDKVARLKAEILKLDVPVDSVVLETVFVELTESGARDIGLNFNNANGQAAYVAYSFGAGNTGSGNGIDTARWGAVSANVQAAIYAEIAKGQGRIISKPRIAAQSGGAAKIITGDALPILTSIALSGVNAVQQQVQYVNVGVTLQIAPRITDDGFVTSHVFAEVSSVTGYSQGYPTISQREASTSVTVKDGQAFVIGGLTQDSNLRNYQKVPLAGDVPVVGQLFRVENSSRAKTELYIVVTPHVVHGNEPVDPAALEHLQTGH